MAGGRRMTGDREPPTDGRGDRTADDGEGTTAEARHGAVLVSLASGAGAGIGPVVVEPGPAGLVTVDGRPEQARLIQGDPPRARLEAADGVHDILLVDLPDPRRAAAGVRRFEVVIDGWRLEVDVESEHRARLRQRASSARGNGARGGPVELRAIIPGRVVSVDVAEGDAVDAGARLLVIEAMKMQNELRSPRSGTVGQVAVGPGQTVELGDLLLVVE
jgi:biotin carboxyl carrier protein